MGKDKKCSCEKGKKPKDCSPEQIVECHPDKKGMHPCEEKSEKDSK